ARIGWRVPWLHLPIQSKQRRDTTCIPVSSASRVQPVAVLLCTAGLHLRALPAEDGVVQPARRVHAQLDQPPELPGVVVDAATLANRPHQLAGGGLHFEQEGHVELVAVGQRRADEAGAYR